MLERRRYFGPYRHHPADDANLADGEGFERADPDEDLGAAL